MPVSKIISLISEAQSIAKKEFGVDNILQPGIIREMTMAYNLGHNLVPEKHQPDAMDDEGNYYEYLSSMARKGKPLSTCNFQLDRMTHKNLYRIDRNKKFYFGMFSSPIEVEEIWCVDTEKVLIYAANHIEKIGTDTVHVNFSYKWVVQNGKRAFINI